MLRNSFRYASRRYCDQMAKDLRPIYTPKAVESINAGYRRAIRARGHFPTEQAAIKCLYLVTRSLDLTGRGRARWAVRWHRRSARDRPAGEL